MPHEEQTDAATFRVVVDHEEQYSMWPADRELPNGWRDAGRTGPHAECLAHIREVWTDMRPLSLRVAMSRARGAARPEEPDGAGA